eukprot:COSAG05_NODE_42_length_26187_cov_393.972286_20_plen_254_part_00
MDRAYTSERIHKVDTSLHAWQPMGASLSRFCLASSRTMRCGFTNMRSQCRRCPVLYGVSPTIISIIDAFGSTASCAISNAISNADQPIGARVRSSVRALWTALFSWCTAAVHDDGSGRLASEYRSASEIRGGDLPPPPACMHAQHTQGEGEFPPLILSLPRVLRLPGATATTSPRARGRPHHAVADCHTPATPRRRPSTAWPANRWQAVVLDRAAAAPHFIGGVDGIAGRPHGISEPAAGPDLHHAYVRASTW